jgi:hypothetical protein
LLAATSNGDPKSQVRFFSIVPELVELDEIFSLNLKVETFPGLFLQSPTMPPTKGWISIPWLDIGNYEGGSITVPLTSCLTGLD